MPGEDLYREFGSLAEGLQSFERYYIHRAVTEARGDVADAARRLGVRPETLQRKIKRLKQG